MLQHEEPTLFGAPPGHITSAALEVTTFEAVRRITLSGRPANRKEQMQIVVRMDAEDHSAEVIGAMMSVMLRLDNMGSQLWRRTLWAIHNRLGREGYEVEIRNCGRDPMERR